MKDTCERMNEEKGADFWYDRLQYKDLLAQMIEVLRVLPPQLEAKTGASFDIQECEDVEGALIVAATVPAVAAAAVDPRPGGGALSLGPGVRTLRMRVDDGYPARPPTLLFPEPAGVVSSNSAQVRENLLHPVKLPTGSCIHGRQYERKVR